MKIHSEKMSVSLLALAVQSALVAMFAMPVHAEEDEITALTIPTNYLEVGASNTSKSSAKFGEYTGLNNSGADLVGNFSVRGGDAYGDSNGTKRWAVTGSDLGTTSRTLGASLSNQGQWNIGILFDELRHNVSDSYQTPYLGDMGGNTFTLPASFGVVSSTAPGTRTLNAAQQAAMHSVEVGTTRKNKTITAGINLSKQLNATFDFNRMDQSGAKLMAFGAVGGGTGLATTLPGAAGEAVAILPNPTNYKTDTVNLALNWVGEQGHLTTSYFGSFFHEGYDRVTFQTFAATGTSTNSYMQTMSTAPSNTFHQLNLSGGYALAAKTKLTGGVSYGRNTQNDAFVYDSYMMVTPITNTSLNGLVVNTHGDLKLTNQTIDNLALSAGIKYDQRNNRTASNIYNFNALSGNTAHYANYPNTPLSNKKTQLELAGDYRLAKSQNVRLAYNREDVKRWCDQYAVNANYPAGTNCVVATASKDDRLSATYRLKATDAVGMNVGYSYSKRKTDSDPNAIASFISKNGNVAPGAVTGINAGDFLGFYPYFDASRKQQMLKAGVNWQALEKLSLGLLGRYTNDKYDSTYGVQNGKSSSLNLDATYSYHDNSSVSAYLTKQHRERTLTDFQKVAVTAASVNAISTPVNATWSNDLKDDDTTVGLSVKHGGLMGNKLELAGDLTYSMAKTIYNTQLNYAGTTTGGLTCSDPTILSCGQLPDISNTLIQLKLSGNYQLDKSAKVALGYIYQKLKSSDYYYNGLQYGATPNTLLPTNEQAPNYSVSLLTATYIYTF
ncbi:MAG: MtrB/PioB family decaheme-associated outer membrane protein [Sideroxydans sp.]|nr:MtrB/PioB family decaheme-associated outer membrane protein [Sideroxydans sp.]